MALEYRQSHAKPVEEEFFFMNRTKYQIRNSKISIIAFSFSCMEILMLSTTFLGREK